MAKSLSDILKAGNVNAEALRKMQASAAVIGKRVIHIELDLASGQFKSQATPMDNITLLGMIEFYKATILGNMLGRGAGTPPSAPEPKEESPAPEAAAAPSGANKPVPEGEGKMIGDRPAPDQESAEAPAAAAPRPA